MVVSTRSSVKGRVHVTGGAGTDRLLVQGTSLREDITVGRNTAGRDEIVSTEWEATKRAAGDDTVIDHAELEGVTIRSGDGADRILVRRINVAHTIDSGAGDDEIAIGTGTDFGTRTVDDKLVPAVVTTGGTVDLVQAALELTGGVGTDSLWLDDAADTNNNTGTLTLDRITGLDMIAVGVGYVDFEALDIDLGTGNDALLVESTHGAGDLTRFHRTDLTLGAGDDTVNIRTIDGPTTSTSATATTPSGWAARPRPWGRAPSTASRPTCGSPPSASTTRSSSTTRGAATSTASARLTRQPDRGPRDDLRVLLVHRAASWTCPTWSRSSAWSARPRAASGWR